MNDAKYIGMDVHQATISAAVRDSSGSHIFPICKSARHYPGGSSHPSAHPQV
jgi:hypothetical protein